MTFDHRKKARVLALAAEAFGGHGGIAQSTRDFMMALSAIPGIDGIDILPRLRPEPAQQLPAGIRQFPACSSRLEYARRALWLALTRRPKIVYCGHVFMAPLAYLVARVVGARFVSHVHGLEVWQPLPPSKRYALAASDMILCVSQHTADKVVEITGADSERCKIIYNTFDERFTPGDRSAALERFKIPADAIVISTVSRLDAEQRHKGHDRVIPLLKELNRHFPKLSYLIAGTGGDRERLEALVHETGAADIVRFLGFVPDEDLPSLYLASDLYVMPSHGEGFGIAFVEAMACGTPALGLDLGGAGEALRHGELGRAVAEADFSTALSAALATPQSDRADLAARTNAIFGRRNFETRVAAALAPVLLSACPKRSE